MVLAGNISQLVLPDSLKASRWSKRRRSVVARSHGHSKQMMNDGSKIQVPQRHVLYGFLHRGYPPAHRLKYLTSY